MVFKMQESAGIRLSWGTDLEPGPRQTTFPGSAPGRSVDHGIPVPGPVTAPFYKLNQPIISSIAYSNSYLFKINSAMEDLPAQRSGRLSQAESI